MATYQSGTRNTYYAILTVTEREPTEAQIVANKTTLDWSLYLYSGSNRFSGYTIGHSVNINGVNVRYQNNSGNQTSMSANSSKYVASGSLDVTHDSDGSKTVPVSFSIWTDNISYLPVSLSASGNFTCRTLPRVSDLEIDVDTVPADGISEVIATATKKSDVFTDALTISLGDYSKAIESDVAFTIPEEWNNAISGTSAVATVKVETFTGETSIGSKSVELTVTVPDTVVPVINEVNISEAVAAVTSAFSGLYVQNLSQLNVSIDASGAYGSTIKSYSAILDGVNYIQQAFTSNVIKTAGTLDIVVNITDSRGRTAKKTVMVDIVEYMLPTITSMTYTHCDSDGTQNSSGESTKVTIAGKVYSVENKNTKVLKLKYKPTADATYTERVVTLSDWTFSVDVIINNTDPTITYEYIAELTDKINADSPETFRVTTGIVVLSRLAGGGGITLFAEATEEGFIVSGGKISRFTGDMYITVDEEFMQLYNAAFGEE